MFCHNCKCESCINKEILKNEVLKRCTSCKEIKDKSKFNTATGKKKNGEIKLKSYCIECQRLKNAEYYMKKKNLKRT